MPFPSLPRLRAHLHVCVLGGGGGWGGGGGRWAFLNLAMVIIQKSVIIIIRHILRIDKFSYHILPYLLCMVGLKVGSGNWGTDLDQSLGDGGSSVLACSSTTLLELEVLLSGAMDCSFAFLAQRLGRGGGRGVGSSMSVSWSSPVSVLEATEVRLPEE